jgi:molybdenum cofactor cytidylyltransferase
MKAENCALIILASGLSERFGKADKLMANFRGKPLVQHVIEAAKPLPFAERFAVIPKMSTQRRKLFNYEGYSLIENENPEAGQGGSLMLAAKAVMEKGHEAICVMLGDMPFVETDDLFNLIQNLSDKDRAISHCNKTLIPPVVFSKQAMPELLNTEPGRGAKALFRSGNFYKHPLSERASRDIDTLETLAELS